MTTQTKPARGTEGRVARGPLAGTRVVLVRFQLTSGQPLVRLLEDRSAYVKGDTVQLGTGEFIPDQPESEDR